MSDNPYRMPPPTLVADLCAQAAWGEDISDDNRLRLEWAADTIRMLMARAVRQAKILEETEARL